MSRNENPDSVRGSVRTSVSTSGDVLIFYTPVVMSQRGTRGTDVYQLIEITPIIINFI